MPDDQLLNNYTAANIQRQCRGREIEELNRQMSELRAENATLKNEVHEWQESDAATKVLGPAFEEQIAELTQKLNEAQAQVETAGRNAAHYADMSLELEKQVAELTRQRDYARDQNGDLFAEKVSLEQFSGRLTLARVMLRRVCAEAYQLAGVVGAPEAALDNLSDAAHGAPLRHETFLPVLDTDCSVIADLRERLAKVIQNAEEDVHERSLATERTIAELARKRDEAQNEAQENWESVKRLTARAEAAERERDEAIGFRHNMEHASKIQQEDYANMERQVAAMRDLLKDAVEFIRDVFGPKYDSSPRVSRALAALHPAPNSENWE